MKGHTWGEIMLNGFVRFHSEVIKMKFWKRFFFNFLKNRGLIIV